MTQLSVHNVKRIIMEDAREQFSGSFVRGFKIETTDGQEIEITLFSKNSMAALEPVPEDMEDWK